MYETKYIEHQNNIRVDSYMLRESQIGPETSLNEENRDEFLFYGLGIVQGLRVVLDWYLSPRSSMDIVDVSENELNSYLASLLPKLIFSCLFSTYSYVNILLEI